MALAPVFELKLVAGLSPTPAPLSQLSQAQTCCFGDFKFFLFQGDVALGTHSSLRLKQEGRRCQRLRQAKKSQYFNQPNNSTL